MAAAARIAGREAPPNRAELSRWAASAAAVLAVYAAALAVLMTWRSAEAPLPPPPPSAVMVDLAPLQPPAPPVAAPTAPPPPVQAKPQPQPKPVKPPPEAKAPAVALPLPPPPPPPQAAPRRPAPPVEPQAAPSAPAAPAPPQAAPAPAAPSVPTPSNVLLPFEARLVAHLERYKRYPREAQARRQQGVVRLRFTIDRSGKVLAARIDKSSGYPALDDEVLAMIERAAPLPAFPPEIKEAQLELLLPIAFSLR